MAEIPKINITKMLEEAFKDVRPSMAEALRPVRMIGLAHEAIEEVARARALHGPNSDLSDGAGPGRSILQEMGVQGGIESNHDLMLRAQHVNDTRCAEGRKHTRAGIVFEEFLEALAATSDVERRTELIQTIAMLLDWTLDVSDRIAAANIDEVCS